MRPRDLVILCTALGFGATVGLVLLGSDSLAVELPVPSAAGEEPPPAPTVAAAPAEASGDSVAPVAVAATAGRSTVDTAGWTTGEIRGDIQLSVAALDQLTTLTIVVEELRQPYAANGTYQAPWRTAVPVPLGRSTPTFVVREVPFSDYPYCVTAYAPGLNGERRTLTINRDTPLADDVVLAITPAAPYSLLLRDQDSSPYPNLDVRLVPVGEPAGRPPQSGRSDAFGSVVFDGVLGGDYQVVVGKDGQPLGTPQTVTVQAGGRIYQGKVQGQGQVVTIPRGVPLVVHASDVRGYGIADAYVKLTATDRVKLTVLEGRTDFSGKAEFPYLTPGLWQIEVGKDDFQNRIRQLTVVDRQLPDPVQMQLVRLR